MNLTQVKSKFYLVIIAFVIIVVVVGLISIISFKNNSGSQNPSPQTAPSIAPNVIVPPKKKPTDLPSDIQEIRKKIIASQIGKTGGDILLYKTASFVIEYIPTPDIFFVTISKDPALDAKQQAQKWFLDFGLQQNNLCDLPVRFILGNLQIRKTNPNFTSLPDGCSTSSTTKP